MAPDQASSRQAFAARATRVWELGLHGLITFFGMMGKINYKGPRRLKQMAV